MPLILFFCSFCKNVLFFCDRLNASWCQACLLTASINFHYFFLTLLYNAFFNQLAVFQNRPNSTNSKTYIENVSADQQSIQQINTHNQPRRFSRLPLPTHTVRSNIQHRPTSQSRPLSSRRLVHSHKIKN